MLPDKRICELYRCEGVYTTYDDATPVSMQIDLSFKSWNQSMMWIMMMQEELVSNGLL